MSIGAEAQLLVFDTTAYKQIRGTAMGTKMAPAFAGLFMADLEEEFWNKKQSNPQFGGGTLMMFSAYRDSFGDFMTRRNSFHHTLKFTHEISDESVIFLGHKTSL